MGFLKKFTKQEISWMMYDWANSAHSVIVVTILPIFFDTVAGYTADSVSSMSTWGFATSLAMAIVALSAPFLGVFGDIRGMRKKLFTAFMLIGVVSVAGLSFTPFMDFTASPEAAGRVAAIVLVLYITSTIGFDASCIYYDAFLTDVTTEDRMDSVSTLGYGLGYIGGSTIPLLIFLIMNAVGVPMLTCLGFIFGLTAVWWLVFSVPLVKNCEQTSGKPYKKGDVGASIKNVFTTMKEIGADKPMLIYIISYFFYKLRHQPGAGLRRYAAGAAAGAGAGPAVLPALHEAGREVRRAHDGRRRHLRLHVYLRICVLYEQPMAVLDAGRALRHQPGRHSGAVPLDVRQAHSRQGPQRRVLRLF